MVDKSTNVIVIGSGIAGMSSALKCAEAGLHVLLVSPFPSERAQSVMAAGGINAILSTPEPGDSLDSFVEDTIKGGSYLGGQAAVRGLCENSENIIKYLEQIGTVFSVEKDGTPSRRAIGGHSHKRSYYCGSSTGKQIVSALVMEVRRYEASGMITRKLGKYFHSALIKDGICYGVALYDDTAQKLESVYADALIVASGGQNTLFGKTTGSLLCDGYVAGKLFTQGALLKNLEFIQYHPTTMETEQKRILISEAARGEGGRLYYTKDQNRVYFMEDKYGPNGNLLTRDVVSREIFALDEDVYLDISFLDKKDIDKKLPEVRDLCMKYRGIDISKEPIPVKPSVHFFMGGLAVHLNHETNIQNLFAVGECASMYHGANRLGGNSLLAAIHSGWKAAEEISSRFTDHKALNELSSSIKDEFDNYLSLQNKKLKERNKTESSFPVMYIRDMLAETMERYMGVLRSEEDIEKGISDVDYYLATSEKLNYDSSVNAYHNYSLMAILSLAKATLECAKNRTESRGSHFRIDHPDMDPALAYSTLISYDEGSYHIMFDKEHLYES